MKNLYEIRRETSFGGESLSPKLRPYRRACKLRAYLAKRTGQIIYTAKWKVAA